MFICSIYFQTTLFVNGMILFAWILNNNDILKLVPIKLFLQTLPNLMPLAGCMNVPLLI